MVYEFDVQENFAADCVICSPDLAEVDEGVDGSEEGAVEPSSSLRDELRYCVWILSVTSCNYVSLNLPGTSVSPVQLFTYFNTHFSSLLATNSQHRIRSSAKYIFAVNTSAF